MIVRYWSARTNIKNAAMYLDYVRNSVLHTLRKIPGYESGELLTRDTRNGIEIVILTRWATERDIQKFAGTDISRANVEPEAEALLDKFDVTAKHFNLTLDMSIPVQRN